MRSSIILLFLVFAVLNVKDATPATSDTLSRSQQARRLFEQHCEKSGEKITRTVDNVAGIFLMKIRQKSGDYGSQFRRDDPYGYDLQGDAYIASFLEKHTM